MSALRWRISKEKIGLSVCPFMRLKRSRNSPLCNAITLQTTLCFTVTRLFQAPKERLHIQHSFAIPIIVPRRESTIQCHRSCTTQSSCFLAAKIRLSTTTCSGKPPSILLLALPRHPARNQRPPSWSTLFRSLCIRRFSPLPVNFARNTLQNLPAEMLLESSIVPFFQDKKRTSCVRTPGKRHAPHSVRYAKKTGGAPYFWVVPPVFFVNISENIIHSIDEFSEIFLPFCRVFTQEKTGPWWHGLTKKMNDQEKSRKPLPFVFQSESMSFAFE